MIDQGKSPQDIAFDMTQRVLDSVSTIVIGKTEISKKLLICLLATGHVLIEDVPGIGKTTIVNALAHALDMDFRRIQFTPDLMPSDVTGFNLYNPKTSEFEFQEGAINTQILLADEINRSSPRTQSALLESMQEGQVTVEGETYDLPRPFMVLATQNPIEHVGTYPLPEAQLDRFMMCLSLGYPSKEEEMDIVSLTSSRQTTKKLNPVVGEDEVIYLQDQVPKIKCLNPVKSYLIEICRKTRDHKLVELGASPRASKMLLRATAAHALMNGRDYIKPDDVQYLAHDVLDHRLILKPQARGQGVSAYDIIQEILDNTVAPR